MPPAIGIFCCVWLCELAPACLIVLWLPTSAVCGACVCLCVFGVPVCGGQVGAYLTTVESIMFELVEDKDHARFKDISALAKKMAEAPSRLASL